LIPVYLKLSFGGDVNLGPSHTHTHTHTHTASVISYSNFSQNSDGFISIILL